MMAMRWRGWIVVAAASVIGLSGRRAAAQTAGGEKKTFEVASVREALPGGVPYSNFPLNAGPQYNAEGGLLTGRNLPLLQYFVFAYLKNMYQIQGLRSQLPEWARTTRFDIQARAEGSPSKDEMRAMMRSLLEERFGVKVHTASREVPVFGLELVRPGKLGSRLRSHTADEPPCDKVPPPYNRKPGEESVPIATVAGGYPAYCGTVVSMPGGASTQMRVGGRAVTMADIALAVGGTGGLERPVLDRTGLTGTFDMTLEFEPETPDPAKVGEGIGGGSVVGTALREQLGLKLVPGVGPVEVVVLDRIQKPSEN